MAIVPFNFGALGEEFSGYSKSRFAVIPIPYEKTTTYVKGTAKGPEAIIDASRNMELYDEELGATPAEQGIATLPPLAIDEPPEEMVEKVKDACLRILRDGKFPVVLGGEHSISLGGVLAAKEHCSEVSVLQLDAHTDLRDEYGGSRYSHACVMRRVREHADAVQAGIRSMSEDEAKQVKKLKNSIFFAKDLLEKDCTKEIIDRLGDNVYVTVDLDVLDPSIMPSVGTPEPGGLGWYEVLKLVKKVTEEKKVVGFDVMELCPNPGNKAPDYTAAKLAYKMMGYVNLTKN